MNKGIDGFRVDLAASLVKNESDKSATIKLWLEMTAWFREQFPEGVLIAEWFNPKLSVNAGFNIDFFRGGSLISAPHRGDPNKPVYFDKEGLGTIDDWYEIFKDQYDNTVGKGYMSSPTGNHDGNRIANNKRGDAEQLKVALTYFLTLPGIPSQGELKVDFVVGNTLKDSYKIDKKGNSTIQLPAVSAVVYKIE